MTRPSTFARLSRASRIAFSSFNELRASAPLLPLRTDATSLLSSSRNCASVIICSNETNRFVLTLIFSTLLLIIFIAFADAPMLTAS